MLGLNGTMTAGLILVILGLIIMAVQWLINRNKVDTQSVDPVDWVQRLLKLMKEFGIGMVLLAVGLVIMLLGALGNGGDEPTPTPTPTATSTDSATT